jgi:two-component system cell cycle sensor histidine kinase/response regulator CckA
MASRANMQMKLKTDPAASDSDGLSLNALPFAAAVAGADGKFRHVNDSWLALFQNHPTGSEWRSWCENAQPDGAGSRAELSAAIQRATEGDAAPFVREGGGMHPRVAISSVKNGALILWIAFASSTGDEAHAQKMESVGRLVGGVAHDFANLLTLIAGYGEILQSRTRGDETVRRELEEIRKATNHGMRLTAQLLGYTRKQIAEPKLLDLNALIGEMHGMLAPIIGENLTLQTALAPDLWKILADAGQMEQVIMNMVLNARDAMPTGGSITIETGNCELNAETAQAHGVVAGAYVLLTVNDTGHGIERSTLGHVFEPFFTTKEKGTGLGLATVHDIVRKAGGDIWVQSTPGQGATFTICLPRALHSATCGEPAAEQPASFSGTETVLLVEDDNSVRHLLTQVLRRRGYKLLEASNAEEALRVFADRGEGIHLVITDMVMPGLSGRELAERLRMLRSDVRIIYMSGYTDDVLIRTGALGPGMSFLQKPLRSDTLAAKVREALDSPVRPFTPR